MQAFVAPAGLRLAPAVRDAPRVRACAPRVRASASAPRVTRRAALLRGAAAALVALGGARGARAAPVDALRRARAALDGVDALIDRAKWDKIRTVIATEPVVSVKKNCAALTRELPEDLRTPAIGTLEELLTALKLLDGVVYGNVFVGEDRQILGTKIDYDTPRIYLADAKEALDTLLEFADLA